MAPEKLDIFLVGPPRFEALLAEEARQTGFSQAKPVQGGAAFQGFWPHVWKANLALRGATRVLVRVAQFHAAHLAQLDKRTRGVAWGKWLKPDVPLRVEVVSKGSKIYHETAAAERVERAITETLGAKISDDAPITLKLRIERDLCVFSLDTSGTALYMRGHRLASGKAPLRESLAALCLRKCGYRGTEPVLDPMCGSGTFPIEAAGMARHAWPGKDRDFAFKHLVSFDTETFEDLRESPIDTPHRFHGSDRDAGAITNADMNAARAGVEDLCTFQHLPISALDRPASPPGLLMVNPPYGGRIGEVRKLIGLYTSFGKVMRNKFLGWRVGLITPEPQLAKACGLNWSKPSPRFSNGGIPVQLWQAKID